MIIKFPIEVSVSRPEIFDYINTSYLDYFITYCVDSRFRESIGLRDWIKKQLNEPSKDMLDTAKKATQTLSPRATMDDKVMACLKYVINNITYVSDNKTWGTDEKWQTAEETLSLKKGDCEDGAILMYVLARLNGVPTNRLLLFAGSVWDGNGSPSTNSTNFMNRNNSEYSDEQCQKELKDFKKEIQYGTIQKVLAQGLLKENDSLLQQSLKKVLCLPIKEKLVREPEVKLCGNLSQQEALFAIDVERLIRENFKYTTLIKIEKTTLLKIWKYYVHLVTQNITVKKEILDNLLKDKVPGTKNTSGIGGHCWLGYRPNCYPLNWIFADWCYWPNQNYPDNRPKFYIQDQKIYGEDERYYSIWFAFNEDKSYSGLRNKYKR